MKKKVLFICVHNSARSQIAAAWLNDICGDYFEAESAGLEPGELNPLAVQVMNEVGIDISHQTSKDVEIYVNRKFDFVITVCDRAKQQCPIFPGAEAIHWGFDDPAEAPSEREGETFRRVREEILQRIRLFLLAN